MIRGSEPQAYPNCEACKESVEHILFECASYYSQRLDYLVYLKTILPSDALKALLRDSIFVEIASFSTKMQGMWVNDECSLWYNRVGNFWHEFEIREQNTPTDQHVWCDKTTPFLRSVWSMALSVMTVECQRFIYLFKAF